MRNVAVLLAAALTLCVALGWAGAPQAGIFDTPEAKPAAQGTLFDAEIPPGEYVAFP